MLYESYQEKKELSDQLGQEKQEEDFIKDRLEKITEQASKSSKEIIADLLGLRKLVEEFGGTEQGRYMIAAKLEAISPKE